MRITVDLPDGLLVDAKKCAAELRVPLRGLIEEALRARLGLVTFANPPNSRKIKWITVAGDLPQDLAVADRAQMRAWLGRNAT